MSSQKIKTLQAYVCNKTHTHTTKQNQNVQHSLELHAFIGKLTTGRQYPKCQPVLTRRSGRDSEFRSDSGASAELQKVGPASAPSREAQFKTQYPSPSKHDTNTQAIDCSALTTRASIQQHLDKKNKRHKKKTNKRHTSRNYK